METILEAKLDMIHQCIKKGEKIRVLYEIIMAELGMNFENTGQEVFLELQKSQDNYYESITLLKSIMENKIEKTDTKKDMVSVSN